MKIWICGEFRDLAHGYNFERLRNSTNPGISGSISSVENFVRVPNMYNVQGKYGRYHEMPQKACQGDFFVM